MALYLNDPMMPRALVRNVVTRMSAVERKEQEQEERKQQVPQRVAERRMVRRVYPATYHEPRRVVWEYENVNANANVNQNQRRPRQLLARRPNQPPGMHAKFVRMECIVPVEYYLAGAVEKTENRAVDSYARIDYTNERTYRKNLEDAKEKALSQIDHEHVSGNRWKVFADQAQWIITDTLTQQQLNQVARNPIHIGMAREAPTWYHFLNGIEDLNAAPIDLSCALNYIVKTYNNPALSDQRRMKKLTVETAIIDMLPMGRYEEKQDKAWWKNEKIRKRTPEELQRWCEKNKISMYAIDSKNSIFHKSVFTASRNRAAFMFVSKDSHLYPISDEKVRKHILACSAATDVKHVGLNSDWASKKQKEAEKELIERMAMPRHVNVKLEDIFDNPDKYSNCNIFYKKLSLYDDFVWIYTQKNMVPKYRAIGAKMVMIKLPNNVELHCNTNHAIIGRDWNDSIAACKALGNMPFRNQSIPTAACEYVRGYHNPKGSKKHDRIRTSPAMRQTILTEQKAMCAACNTKLGSDHEIDHIVGLSQGGDNSRANLQALCKDCHTSKTAMAAAETLFGMDGTQSSFCSSGAKIFQQKRNGFIHCFDSEGQWRDREEVGDAYILSLDGCRFRSNIVEHASEGWLRYTVLDNIVPFDQENPAHTCIPAGNYYVQLDDEGLFTQPFKYSNFYSEVIVRTGLADGIITLDDILYAYIPSLKPLPANYYSPAVKALKEKLAPLGMDKIGVNGWIGQFGNKMSVNRKIDFVRSTDQASYEKFTTNETNGTNVHITRKRFDPKDKEADDGSEAKGYFEIVTENKRYLDDHWAPIFFQILDREAELLYQGTKFMKKNGGRLIYLNTDQVVAEFKDKASMEKAKAEALSKFWDADKKVPVWKAQTDYKVNDDRQERRGDYKPDIDFADYKVIYDDDGSDEFRPIAKQIIDKDCSARVSGLAGTGKTRLCREILDELDERGITYQCLAPTNKAARLMHPLAQTLHKFLSSFKEAKNVNFLANIKYYLIDEISMVSMGFYRVLLYLSRKLPNSRFLIFGDMAQLKAVCDIADFDYEGSTCLWEIAGGNLITLKKCRRADEKLFKLTKMAAEGEDISSQIAKLPAAHYPKSVAFTNHSRMKANKFWMKKLRPESPSEWIYFDKVEKIAKSEPIWCYAGLPVIAIVTRKDEKEGVKIANMDEYEVLSFNKDKRLIRLAMKDTDGVVTNEVIKIGFREFTKLFRPAYSCTIHAAQGCTFKNTPFTIYDWNHPRFDNRLKYVALSRASGMNYINIDQREYVDKNRRKPIESLIKDKINEMVEQAEEEEYGLEDTEAAVEI